MSAKLLVESKQNYATTLMGPLKPRGKPKGFGIDKFKVDWHQEVVICPAGKQNLSWRPEGSKSNGARIIIKFSLADCGVCSFNKQCAKNTERSGRALVLLPQAQYEAREEVKRKQNTPEWLSDYQIRTGSEGTFSQAIDAGLRQNRFRGFKKNHLQNTAIAAGINLQRLSDWFDEIPRAETRTSRFAALRA